MIYSIEGEITVLTEESLCILQTGITWELHISQNTYNHFLSLKARENKDKNVTHKIYTWLHSNDKGMSLFGFSSLAERSVFLSLQKVDGIGPKAAMRILSHTSPESLIASIKSQDTKSLSSISGIGPKKASRILLALEGVYVPSVHISKTNKDSSIDSIVHSKYQDIITGLTKMGYEKKAIEDAISYIENTQEEEISQKDEGVLMHNIIMQIER